MLRLVDRERRKYEHDSNPVQDSAR
jgi:hypothetical protein